jgi:hypothetical protein
MGKELNMKKLLLLLLIPSISSAQIFPSDPQVIWTNPNGQQVDITRMVNPSIKHMDPDGISDSQLDIFNRPKMIIDARPQPTIAPPALPGLGDGLIHDIYDANGNHLGRIGD